MFKHFGPSDANALFSSMAWARAARKAGHKNVRNTFLGNGCFCVSAG